MALTTVEVQSSHDENPSGGTTSTLKWDTLRAVHGGISVDYSPITRCGRSGERYTDDDVDYADDELTDLGLSVRTTFAAVSSAHRSCIAPPLQSVPRSPPYRESGSKNSAASTFRGAVSLHHSDPFAVLPVTPHKPRRAYDSAPSDGSGDTPNLWPFVNSPGSTPSQLLPYPENERDIEMTPGDLCSIRTPDLHRVAPTMARDRVQKNINQSAHLPAYLGRVVSPSAKYDGLQSSPAKFEAVEDEDSVDID